MPVVSKFNVENENYDIEPIIVDELEEGSEEIISNKTAYEAINNLDIIFSSAQDKQLTAVINVGGTIEPTVETALQGLAAYYSSAPASGNVKPFTAGGAYSDKSNVAALNSTKNFTAGGAYAYFNGCTTALAWLKSVFGNDYEQKVARGYFVD